MEFTRLLYDQYSHEKEATKDEAVHFDMIKRIEDYRRNVNLYNTLRINKSGKTLPSSET